MARWKKGQSGNPTGRTKGSKNRSTREIQELIQEAVDFSMLVKKLEERALKGSEQAARLLLEYGYGRPHATGELTIDETTPSAERMSEAANRVIEELLLKGEWKE